MVSLDVTFTAANTIQEKKNRYTIYEIQINNSATKWTLYKRYNEFHVLDKALRESFSSNPKLLSSLPSLPPKRLARSLAPEFVEKRKSQLNTYLSALVKNLPLLKHDKSMAFLQIPSNLTILLKGEGGHSVSTEGSTTNLRFDPRMPFEERKIREFIHNLKVRKNRCITIQEYLNYFFESRPHIQPDHIKILLQGEESLQGLLQCCGDFQHSEAACRSALSCICKLLDVEYNREASSFVEIFTQLDPHILTTMKLHMHISLEYGHRINAFHIVSILRDNQVSVDTTLTDGYSKQEYYKWSEVHNAEIDVSEENSSLLPPTKISADLNIKDDSNHAVSNSIFREGLQHSYTELIKILENDKGWREVARFQKTGLQISYQKDNFRDLITVRVMTVLPHKVSNCIRLLNDSSKRPLWNNLCKEWKIIQKFQSNNDIVYCKFPTLTSPYKFRDFCLARTLKKAKDGSDVIILKSVRHEKTPEFQDHIRAAANLVGVVLTPCKIEAIGKEIDATVLTFIAQLDSEGILVVSPDLLGETNIISETVTKFQTLLDSLAPTK